MKFKSNKQSLNSLLKDLNDIDMVLLRERLLSIAELTKQDIEDNPNHWNSSIVTPRLYLELCDKINFHLTFKD